MAKKVKGKRRPFWKWMARVLVRLANKLPQSDRYIVFRQDNEGQVFSRRDVEMTLREWTSKMKCALMKRVLGVRVSERVAVLYVDDPTRPILPSREMVYHLVDGIVNQYIAQIDDAFNTPEKLMHLKEQLLPVDAEVLTNTIRVRIDTFREYNAKITTCMAFLTEVQSFRENMAAWEALVPVQNTAWNIDALYEYLEGIDNFWLEYAEEKSVANLMAFHNRIGEQRRYVQTYFMHLYPDVRCFECRYLPELIKGALAMKRAMKAVEQPTMEIVGTVPQKQVA